VTWSPRERERLLTAAFMIRVLVLMALVPEAQLSDVTIALAGDLVLVPWSKQWRPACSEADHATTGLVRPEDVNV
jgi:hypothetical protein